MLRGREPGWPARALAFFFVGPVLSTFTPAAITSPAVAFARQQVSAPAQDARIDAGRLIQDLNALASAAMQGRATGTDGNRRARAFIIDRFKQLGLTPVGASFDQPFSFSEGPADQKPAASDGANVMALKEGKDPKSIVLVSAHYDHLGVLDGRTYPGADDNASGVTSLLAIAGWFARHEPPRKSILFVAFDAEERGLRGSRHFVEHPPVPLDRIDVVVNLDMVGRGDANTLFVAGTYPHPALKPVVSEAARGRDLTVAYGHDKPRAEGATGQDDWTNSSDHGPFHAKGIPFLYFGVEDHPDYHKPTDTADKIPRRFFVEATEFILDTVQRLAR